jgi:hypothetical protein
MRYGGAAAWGIVGLTSLINTSLNPKAGNAGKGTPCGTQYERLARLGRRGEGEVMTRRNLLISISVILVGGGLLAAAVLGVLHFAKQQEQHRAHYAFFYENRDLFEDIKDELILIDGLLDEKGYVLTFDEYNNKTRTWYPGLSEDVAYYYEIVPYQRPLIYSRDLFVGDRQEVRQVHFIFYQSGTRTEQGIVYCEAGLPEDSYTRIEGNWYYYRYGRS